MLQWIANWAVRYAPTVEQQANNHCQNCVWHSSWLSNAFWRRWFTQTTIVPASPFANQFRKTELSRSATSERSHSQRCQRYG